MRYSSAANGFAISQRRLRRLGRLRRIVGELENIIMPRRLVRLSLALAVLLSSQAFALGLGEIRINSALNEPLRAEIELLAATPEEIADLRIALASEATFARYGLDRPFYLTEIDFSVFRTGRADGNVIRVTSTSPITEPFLTFLVEATWPSGRLLREYTVLLDPPTFAPPAAQQAPAPVAAPQRTQPADSGRIEREPPRTQPVPAEPSMPEPTPVRPATTPAPAAETTPAPAPEPVYEPEPEPAFDETPTYSTIPGGDLVVQRGDTLWGIATRMDADSSLTINQKMLAIFEANPEAFGGNINMLRAGASLRMPSSDEIFSIDRGDAFREAERQHAEWDSGYRPAPAPAPVAEDTTPSLQLVPPDEDLTAVDTGTDSVVDAEPLTREQTILDRIAEIEAEGVPTEEALIELQNNELASLRQELAEIRGEVYEPPVEAPADDMPVDDQIFVDDAAPEDVDATEDEMFPDFGDEAAEDSEAVADDAADEEPAPAVVQAPSQPSLVDQILGYLTSIYAAIAAVVLLVIGVLVWFLRRGRGDEDDPDSWQPLDGDDIAMEASGGTESLRAPDRDEAFVVEEQEPVISATEDTIETPAIAAEAPTEATGTFDSLEDTFSSETAINLDQSDPIAEADFHMAYGLYDQAADLINGAIEADPGRQDLLSKLCEIYFVWGNRDAFIDAASRLKGVVGGGESAEWDKIVIMGQQIAGDHELFAGAAAAGATKEVDLSFETDDDGGTGALDMEFGEEPAADNVIDLGADTQSTPAAGDDLDFSFDTVADSTNDSNVIDMDLEATAESPTLESSMTAEVTREMPSIGSTVESPTIEEQFEGLDTSELPSLDDTDTVRSIDSTSATAEIELDDLGLDVSGLEETEVAAMDDLDATGTNEALTDIADLADITGKNPEIDPNETGVQVAMGDDIDATGLGEALDIDDVMSRTSTSLNLAADETGVNPMATPVEESTAADLEQELLAATGKTQVLPDDFVVQTGTLDEGDVGIGDSDATMLAPGAEVEHEPTQVLGDDDATLMAGLDDEDDGDFDFAKTEALPPDVFTGGDSDVDQTGELPVASTDVDLDLDDLTAALKVSAGGDTVDMPRDDATVEQPRPDMAGAESPTVSLGPDAMSDDLEDARTMTEVGTKLDLARAYVDMGDPGGARSILEEVLDEGDEGQRQQAQSLLDSLPA